MPVVLCRVDNRLVHGQVLEAWAPKLGVQGIVVVDAERAADPCQRMVFRALDQATLPVRLCSPEEASALLGGPWRDRRTLVLFAGVAQAADARRRGVRFDALNLGNVHPSQGSVPLTSSVYLTAEDAAVLRAFVDDGVVLEARAVPSDRSPDVVAFLRGGP